ncbi:MAG: type 2 isopentenyl-diphosphate Delta-isomerase [Actinobacteria bacterium]|nr:type 2 isopentenyl-diphosphate Delta-isomerase [Actinomycetota bacterium]
MMKKENSFSALKIANEKRKEEHLQISLNKDVSFKKISSGFEGFLFIHQALPDIDMNKIDLSTEIFGKKLSLPLMLSPLVGGTDKTKEINKNLARVASELKIAMSVGSQRTAIENIEVEETYKVREIAPEILLFANLGAVQLNYGFGIEQCNKAVDMIEADSLILHLNPLQEAFQHEGNHNFKNLSKKISTICQDAAYPVIVREVGFGISEETAKKLLTAGVSGIDVGGAGGTSWIEVEKNRTSSRIFKKVAGDFCQWGIPTAESILSVKKVVGKNSVKIIASGGIRSGLDVAKAIALGADIAGIGLPVLKNIHLSIDKCMEYIMEVALGLKIAMFGIGASSISELKNSKYLKKKKDDF